MTEPLDLGKFEGHTPGPWGSKRGTIWRLAEPESTYTYTNDYVCQCEDTESEATMDLVIAAPQLLAALRETRAALVKLVELMDNRLPGAFANGVKCPNDVLEQGEEWAFEITDRARVALALCTQEGKA